MRYTIASGDDNRDFAISEDAGTLRVAKNLNYERKPRYRLQVRAEDSPPSEETGETRIDHAEVVINLVDINDNAPVFLDTPYLAHVMENMVPQGGFIKQVSPRVTGLIFVLNDANQLIRAASGFNAFSRLTQSSFHQRDVSFLSSFEVFR